MVDASHHKDDHALSQEGYAYAKRTGQTYDDYETWKKKEQEAAGKRKKPAAVKEPTKEERRDTLIADYAFGLEHNTPRTPAELAELRTLLGVEAPPNKLTDEEKKKLDEGTNIKQPLDLPTVEAVQYDLEPGTRVPVHQALADVPLGVVVDHPQWKGHQFFRVGKKGEKVVIVDRDRRIVAVT